MGSQIVPLKTTQPVARAGIAIEDPRAGRLTKEALHRLVDAAEGASPAAQRARELLLAHFALARERAAPAPHRGDGEARAQRVRDALRELGVAPGEASVRAVAARAGLPATTTYRVLRQMGAPARSRAPPAAPPADIVVAACGGVAMRTLARIPGSGLAGARTLALDADAGALEGAQADVKLLLGDKRVPSSLRRALSGASLVLVLATLGSDAGAQGATLVAQTARGRGATVVCLVPAPFRLERARHARADQALGALRPLAHTLLVLESERLLRLVPHLPLDQAYRVMDALVADVVQGIVETSTGGALLTLDRADARELLGRGGVGTLLHGEARVGQAAALVRDALAHAFLDAEPRAATGALVQLAGGAGLALEDVHDVAREVAALLPSGAPVACGARVLPELAGRMRLSLLLTGLPLTGRTPSP